MYNLNYWTDQFSLAISLIQIHFLSALKWVGVLWIIHLINRLLSYRLNYLGIIPRHFQGLFGIIFAPLLHHGTEHLFFNSIPLIILIDLVLLQGNFLAVSSIIILASGLCVWVIGRRGIHLGASALVMGYWGYLLTTAYRYPSMLSLLSLVLCLYYFSGLILNLFPLKKHMSWEGHISGFLAGILAGYLGF